MRFLFILFLLATVSCSKKGQKDSVPPKTESSCAFSQLTNEGIQDIQSEIERAVSKNNFSERQMSFHITYAVIKKLLELNTSRDLNPVVEKGEISKFIFSIFDFNNKKTKNLTNEDILSISNCWKEG